MIEADDNRALCSRCGREFAKQGDEEFCENCEIDDLNDNTDTDDTEYPEVAE